MLVGYWQQEVCSHGQCSRSGLNPSLVLLICNSFTRKWFSCPLVTRLVGLHSVLYSLSIKSLVLSFGLIWFTSLRFWLNTFTLHRFEISSNTFVILCEKIEWKWYIKKIWMTFDDISNQRELRVFCQNLIKVNDILTIVI